MAGIIGSIFIERENIRKIQKRPAIKASRSITTVGAEGFEPPTLCL